MTNYPKISIVTPNSNGAEYLEDTIKSVVEQKYPNLEYIVYHFGINHVDTVVKDGKTVVENGRILK